MLVDFYVLSADDRRRDCKANLMLSIIALNTLPSIHTLSKCCQQSAGVVIEERFENLLIAQHRRQRKISIVPSCHQPNAILRSSNST